MSQQSALASCACSSPVPLGRIGLDSNIAMVELSSGFCCSVISAAGASAATCQRRSEGLQPVRHWSNERTVKTTARTEKTLRSNLTGAFITVLAPIAVSGISCRASL